MIHQLKSRWQVLPGFTKVTHEIPMLSMGDVFSEAELAAFDQRLRKNTAAGNPSIMSS